MARDSSIILLYPKTDISKISPKDLKVILITNDGKSKTLDTVPELVTKENLLKLNLTLDKGTREGKARIYIYNKDNKITEAGFTILKLIKSPKINNKVLAGNLKDKNKFKLTLTGEDFVNKYFKLKDKTIQLTDKDSLSVFTTATFVNPKIKISEITFGKNENQLIIRFEIDKNYIHRNEELIISTPIGQTIEIIELPEH